MKIEEIKKKLRDYNADVVASLGCNDPVDFSLDVAFMIVENEKLLSIIEQQKAEIATKDTAILAWIDREDKLKSSFDKLESKQLADQKAIIKQAEKALEKAIVQMANDHNELAMEFGYAEKANDSEAMRESQQALQAIRGSE